MRRDVLVIMPFSDTNRTAGKTWNNILEHIFKPAVRKCGYECGAIEPSTGSLTVSIVRKIHRAWIVLADITDSNANVLYELGVRNCLSRRTIIVTQREEDIPSDLRGYWYIKYDIEPGGMERFYEKLRGLVSDIKSNPAKSDNPVSDYLETEDIYLSSVEQKKSMRKLSAIHTEITGNEITLHQIKKRPLFVNLLTTDCLNLLLTTKGC